MTDTNMADQTVFLPRAIGPYRIERELGAGAMGTVFQALHTGLDRTVALKVLRPDMVQDPDAIRRFLREARSIARLEHPNVVAVYDAGEVDGLYYIAMKLLEGETLLSLLARTGPLPTDRIVGIGAQIASALDYAHARDVVHLDVKPANVIVGASDRTVLTDFGIAQALHPGATRTGTIAGTPLYMSPEQIEGHQVDSRADLYSLGLVLYEMCVGHPPFQGQFITVMYAHLHTPVPDLRETVPDIPPELAKVIHRALAKNASERYQTAGDMVRALRGMIPGGRDAAGDTLLVGKETPPGRATLSVAPHETTPPRIKIVPPEVRRRRRAYAFTAMGGVVAGIALAAALFLHRGSTVTTGAVQISSIPSGASVSLDGVPRGRTPLTLQKIENGHHTLALSYRTYNVTRVPVDVRSGKTVSVDPVLASLPPENLLETTFGTLTTSLSWDGKTYHVGAPLVSISSAQFKVTTIAAIAELRLRRAARGVRDVKVSPQWRLYYPNGSQVPTTRQPGKPVTFKRNGAITAVITSFSLKASTITPPAGTWQVKLIAAGHTLQTLKFTVTQ